MEESNFVNSYNFAKNADVVYSQVLTHQQFEKLELENFNIINSNEFFIFYKLNQFNVKSNSILFCNSSIVECLFKDLRKYNSLKNLTLIVSQTDRTINKRLIKKIPNSIIKVFAINIKEKTNILHPIPIGIANNYSPKNLLAKDLNIDNNFNSIKEFKIYLNFNELTNPKHRTWLKNYFNNFEWAYIENETLTLEEYKLKISNFQFILCPWGNGIDTHRIWESLYLGSIPVVKYHPTFENLLGLPVIFVENYKQITLDFLKEKLNEINLTRIDLNFLDINYWLKYISNNTNFDTDFNNKIYKINSNEKYFKYHIFKRKFINILIRKYRLLRFRYFQIKKYISKKVTIKV